MPESVHNVYRSSEYRLIPGSREKAKKLASLAGACRWAWNAMLARQQQLYEDMVQKDGEKAPAPTFSNLGVAFTQLRKETPWLKELPYGPVRYALKYQADAWKRFFQGEIT